jgi:FecR-like protein
MQRTPRLFSCAAIFLVSLAVIPTQTKAKEEGEPQMVWLSYAEGEVKFSPGHKGQARLGKDWIEASRGQVMEDGYTLVTEKGRTEIEFENGTVVYLAENSALEFDRLWAGATAMETRLNLVAGTATVAHPAGDEVQLDTPVMRMRFIGAQTTRVECALDGVVMETMEGTQNIFTSAGETTLKAGESAAYVDGRLIPLKGVQVTGVAEELNTWAGNTVRKQEMVESGTSDEWDQWVAERLATRRALVAKGLKESGMEEPIPGLAEMMASGTFMDCAPYGKCWHVNALTGTGARTMQTAATPGLADVTAQAASSRPGGQGYGTAGGRNGRILVNRTMMTRCPMQVWQATARGQQNGAQTVPVQYGTCFAGSWYNTYDPCLRPMDPWDPTMGYLNICQDYQYWVVGRRYHHHHHHPCHFVKTKNGVGIVPRHPLDAKGKPPVNAKSGVLVLTKENGKLVAGVEKTPSRGVVELAQEPRGMTRGLVANAPRVPAPVIEAKLAETIVPRGVLSAGHVESAKNVTAIRLDMKTGNFVGTSGTGGGSHAVSVGHVGEGGGGSAHGGSGGGGGGGHSGGGGASSGGGGGGHSGGGGGASGGGGGGGHH